MWLLTPRGFFSAVRKPDDEKDEMLTIRARAKADLENLHDLLPDAVPYQLKTYSDYPWRIRVPQKDWALAVTQMALEVDYDNFKNEVTRTQGQARHDIYSKVWAALLAIEGKFAGSSGGYGFTGGDTAWDQPKIVRSWEPGDRFYDTFKKKPGTVTVDDGTNMFVIYDDAPDDEVRLMLRSDAKPLRVVGDRVWDEWAQKNGRIESLSPLVVLYDDGHRSDKYVRFDDLEDVRKEQPQPKRKQPSRGKQQQPRRGRQAGTRRSPKLFDE